MSVIEGLVFGRAIGRRRTALKSHFDVRKQFEEIEESCIPSYVHGNVLAAWVAWQRTRAAASLYNRHAPEGPILDFGAATGEVGHLIDKKGSYTIIEQDDVLAGACTVWQPAERTTLEDGEAGRFAAIFALDSLEHNDDIGDLVGKLLRLLRPDGVFILSGPTESRLYKLGRRIAGFTGHYHHSNIYDIETLVERHARRVAVKQVPIVGALFRVTLWSLHSTTGESRR